MAMPRAEARLEGKLGVLLHHRQETALAPALRNVQSDLPPGPLGQPRGEQIRFGAEASRSSISGGGAESA